MSLALAIQPRSSLRTALDATLLTINVLSLDAIAVALVWQSAIGRVVHLSPTLAERGELAAVVGAIYLLDRQLDAAKLRNLCHATARHAAHRRFASLVRPLIPACLLVAALLLPSLSRSVWIAGTVLSILTAAHLAIVQLAPRLLAGGRKELSVGILFASGCAIHALAQQPTNPTLLLAIAVTGMLFAFNCLSLGTWESVADAAQGFSALDGHLRTDALPRLGGWLMLLGFVWTVAANRLVGESVASASLLLIALNEASKLRYTLAVRVLADLVLLTPLLWMFGR